MADTQSASLSETQYMGILQKAGVFESIEIREDATDQQKPQVELEQQQQEANVVLRDDEIEQQRAEPATQRDDEHEARLPETIQESANAYRVTESQSLKIGASPHARRRTLQLSSQHSAPGEMEVVAQSHLTPGSMPKTKAASFSQGTSSVETQEYPSQLVKSWSAQENESGIRTWTGEETQPDSYQETGDDAPRTAQKGDAGYVDLADNFVPSSPYLETQKQDETQNYEEELLRSQANDDSPDEHRFAVPAKPDILQTPATIGLRRDDSLPSGGTTAQTERFTNLFAGYDAPHMAQSQLFAMTQEPSSPMPDGPRSDITRPSPNEFNPTQLRNEFSSPTDMRHPRPRSANRDPSSQYETISQEKRRKAHLREQQDAAAGLEELDDEENELDDTQSQARRLRKQQSERINLELARIRAPRSNSRPTSSRKQKGTIDLTTPATTRKDAHVDFALDPETEDEEDIRNEEDDLPQEYQHEGEDGEDHDDNDNDNDEYDELQQTITRSQADVADDYENNSVVDSVEDGDVDMDDAHEDRIQHTDGMLKQSQHAMNTQGSTIADSQTQVNNGVSNIVTTMHAQQSSTASFIPGSQYQGKTSEEQAILASSQRRSQSRIAASQLDGPETGVPGDKVPSSPPPLPAEESTGPEDSADASLARRDLLEQFRSRQSPAREESNEEPEIPESDLPELERPQTGRSIPESETGERPHTARSVQEEDKEETQETNGAPYSTARTHVSGSARSPAKSVLAPSPAKLFESQQSLFSGRTPVKGSGIRRFADMPAFVPQDNSFEMAMEDVDSIVGGLMTKDDRQVLELTSDPSEPEYPRAKRRKLNSNVSSNDSSSDAQAATTPPTSHTRPDVEMRDQFTASDAAGTIAESEQDLVIEETTPRALRNSPSKANEFPVCQSRDEDKLRESTTESQFLRERAGAHAVSQLVAARPKKSKAATYGKAARRAASKESTTPKKKSSRAKTPVPVVEESVAQEEDEPVTQVHLGVEGAREVEMQVGGSEQDGDTSRTDPVDGAAGDNQALQVTAPKRIFAVFKGASNQFFPATWVGSSADGLTHKVRFDDGTTTNIMTHLVGKLEIKVGDNVKVDLPGARNKTFIVVGFGEVASPEQNPETDIYGHSHVKVQVKASRNSLPAAGASQATGEVQEVPVSNVYLTHSMWSHFLDRKFASPSTASAAVARDGTPSTRSGTPNVDTPGSRRRAAKPTTKVKAESRVSHLRETSVASSSASASTSAIFSGMAFAVSYGNNEAEKAEVTRQIQRNGGLILADGFEELFDLPDISEAGPGTPRKRSPKKTDADTGATPGLRLKSQYRHLGFVALIADRHSRRAKYMQALALGLPTISGRWVLHSLDASKNPIIIDGEIAPLAWDKYLLPAGESSYLGGAVRSRSLAAYDAQSSSLQTTIAARPLLLNGETVLLGPTKKGSAGLEKRKTYAFLTRALGAGQLKRVDDLSKARNLLEEDSDKAKLLYVDGDVQEVHNTLFGKSVAGKKRKRASEGTPMVNGDAKMSATHGNVKIVNDEFVIQSLILGALVD